jgi:NAD-dependent deacetylase
MPLDAQEIRSLRSRAAPIVVLTGAGISRESGLHTFRDADGIWATVRVEDVATPEAFRRDPARVHAFYNARRRALLAPEVRPNPAHHALVRLGRHWPGPVLIVTQNIDDLHERAGTPADALVHMHGELLKMRCAGCGAVAPVTEDLSLDRSCDACGCPGQLRPHVVWFGEMPLALERIYAALAEAGLFIAIGTSGSVYPAAGFVRETPPDCITVELNLEPSEIARLFRHAEHGPASIVVPAFVDRLCPP